MSYIETPINNADLSNSAIAKRLIKKAKSGNLFHFYLFYGPKGSGKNYIAHLIAGAMLSEDEKESTSRNNHYYKQTVIDHPDIITINTGVSIGINAINNIKKKASLKPTEAKRKIIIINDASFLTKEAANAFLKFLEEPNKNVIVILITTFKEKILPTILSRSLPIYFKPASKTKIKNYLKSVAVFNQKDIDVLASLAGGDIFQAIELAKNKASVHNILQEVEKFMGLLTQGLTEKLKHLKSYDFKNKTDICKKLDLWIEVLRDVLMIKIEQVGLVKYKMASDVFDNYAKKYSLEEIYYKLKILENSQAKLETNVSRQLLVENILINL